MKKMIMTALAVLLTASHALAADGFVVSDITIPQGGSATLEIGLNNSVSECKGFQFLLTFDKEVAVTDISKTTRYPDEWDLFSGKQNAEGYQILSANAMNPSVLTGTSGSVVELTLAPDTELTQGTTITATLSNCFMSDAGANQTVFEDVTFTITIGEPDDGYIKFRETSTTLPDYTAGEKGNVRMFRTIVANKWNTIVLPFTLTKAKAQAAFGDDVQLAEFSGFEVEYADEEDVTPDGITINFSTYTMTSKKGMTGGKPFLIKTSKDIESFEATECTLAGAVVDVAKADEYDTPGVFTGSFVKTTVPTDGLFIYDNKFYYSAGSTNIKAFRAWFELGAVLDKETSFEANVRFVVDDEVTSIDGIPSAADKMGAVYNLNGQLIGFDIDVNSLPAGIYIKDGQKIVVK
ncbi:MAG: hypothetical protein Q4F47_03385 [Bacteroidaceae bacterium]|nr:hypothetical protein [Bacteroidaceae bacterium]